MKSGLSAGNPHRFDGADREAGGSVNVSVEPARLLSGLRRERERLSRLAEMKLDNAAVKCIDPQSSHSV